MRHIGLVLLCTGLAGCGGGSAVVDNGDPPLDIFSFGTALAATQSLAPSSDMQTSGSAQYTGAVRLSLVDAGAIPVGAVTGQLSFSVNFDQSLDLGQPSSVINASVTGTIDDIAGQTSEGDALTLSGSLTTGQAPEPSFAAVSSTTFPGPNGDITAVTGGLAAQFAGDVTVNAGSDATGGTAYVTLGGSFVGDAGEAVWGSALAVIVDRGQGPDTAAALSGAGEFVATQ